MTFYTQNRYSGNAIGFKIKSLLILRDTRSNKSQVTLLHYIVEQIEKEKKEMLDFVNDLHQPLIDVSRYTRGFTV